MRHLHTGSAFSETAFHTARAEDASEPARAPASEKREWTISEMARDFGLTLRALRFYESKGLIAPQRFGGARYYGGRDRARLAMVLNAKKMGFTLTEAAAMIGRADGETLEDLPLSAGVVESQIAFLETQKQAIEAALHSLRGRQDRKAAPAA